MKKQFFAISLLLATGGAQATDTLKLTGAVAGTAAVLGLLKAAHWDKQIKDTAGREDSITKNETNIFTVLGKPFGITGRDMLGVFNTATVLTTAGCLSPEKLGPIAVTAGGVGGVKLATQSLFGNHNQEENPLNTNQTVKYVGVGAVLGTAYKHVPAVNSFVNGLLGWNK